MKNLTDEIKLTIELMQGDIDDGAHGELQSHLYSLLEMKRELLGEHYRETMGQSQPKCEYTLEQVIGDTQLSDWARWVAVDKNGDVFEYDDRPVLVSSPADTWVVSMDDGDCNWVKDIEPPSDFTKCIWEIKK